MLFESLVYKRASYKKQQTTKIFILCVVSKEVVIKCLFVECDYMCKCGEVLNVRRTDTSSSTAYIVRCQHLDRANDQAVNSRLLVRRQKTHGMCIKSQTAASTNVRHLSVESHVTASGIIQVV